MTAKGDLNSQDKKLLRRLPQLLGVRFASEPAKSVSKYEMEIRAGSCDILFSQVGKSVGVVEGKGRGSRVQA